MINSKLDASKQQLGKNRVVILDKAQIAIDTLPKQEQENIMNIINCLEYFPDCSQIEYKTLSKIPNYFMTKVGLYRVIFDFQPGKVTIIDIVNYERIKILYSSYEEVEA